MADAARLEQLEAALAAMAVQLGQAEKRITQLESEREDIINEASQVVPPHHIGVKKIEQVSTMACSTKVATSHPSSPAAPPAVPSSSSSSSSSSVKKTNQPKPPPQKEAAGKIAQSSTATPPKQKHDASKQQNKEQQPSPPKTSKNNSQLPTVTGGGATRVSKTTSKASPVKARATSMSSSKFRGSSSVSGLTMVLVGVLAAAVYANSLHGEVSFRYIILFVYVMFYNMIAEMTFRFSHSIVTSVLENGQVVSFVS